jgi:hypothetical protein
MPALQVGLLFLVTRYQIKAGISGARALDAIVENRGEAVIRNIDSDFADFTVKVALRTLYVPFIVEGYHYYTYQSPKPMAAWAENEGKAVRGLYTGRFVRILTHEEIKSLIEDHKIGDKPPSNWIDEFIKCADQLTKMKEDAAVPAELRQLEDRLEHIAKLKQKCGVRIVWKHIGK